MTASRAELLLGADYEGDENFCHTVVNSIKNHFRVSDPCVAMTERQPGEILSDPDDDKLYHVGGESGYPCDEILQATRSCDVIPEFKGVDYYDACNGDYATIRGIDEPGLGHRLTFGLNDTTRVLIICDAEDVDVDFGRSPQANPTMYFYSADTHNYFQIRYNQLFASSTLEFQSRTKTTFKFYFDMASDNPFNFISDPNVELTDTNAEQAWMYIAPKIRQTSTAGYVAVLVDVTEASLGDASAGAGYNALIDLRVAGTTQFGIQNGGQIMTNQVEAGAIGAYDRRIPIYDETGSLEGYLALYAAP